jgi:hypothetical protein
MLNLTVRPVTARLENSVSQTFLLETLVALENNQGFFLIIPHVNTEYPGDRYPKLQIYITELILGSYEYT